MKHRVPETTISVEYAAQICREHASVMHYRKTARHVNIAMTYNKF